MEKAIYKHNYIVYSDGRVWSNITSKFLKHTTSSSNGYISVSIGGRSETLHTILASCFLGYVANNRQKCVDHVNNVKTDNRLENLQVISVRKNTSKDKNKSDTSSIYIGVYKDSPNRWVARIRVDGKKVYLGSYKCEFAAHLAYQKALKELN